MNSDIGYLQKESRASSSCRKPRELRQNRKEGAIPLARPGSGQGTHTCCSARKNWDKSVGPRSPGQSARGAEPSVQDLDGPRRWPVLEPRHLGLQEQVEPKLRDPVVHTVAATNNWWGNATGLYDPSPGPPDFNPTGLGDPISDYVVYRPWFTSPLPGVCDPAVSVSDSIRNMSGAPVSAGTVQALQNFLPSRDCPKLPDSHLVM